jgi:hypothetical protein
MTKKVPMVPIDRGAAERLSENITFDCLGVALKTERYKISHIALIHIQHLIAEELMKEAKKE